ncbi:MAG: hypothetical protein AB7N71_09680, partial [Phycisphaerae bacterium]
RAILVTAGILGLSIGLLEMPFMAFRSLRSVSDAERAAAHFVQSALDTRAVVQPEPDHRPPLLQLTERRFAVANPDDAHVQVFAPADGAKMRRDVDAARGAFRTADSAVAWKRLAELGVDYVWIGENEHAICGVCVQFRHPAFFDPVFEDDVVTVVRVRKETGSSIN